MDRSYKTKAGANKFRTHLHTTVNADHIDNMTRILDGELTESQNTMNQIASIFASIKNLNNCSTPVHNLDRHAAYKFLEAEPLKLVTPEYAGVKFEGDVDEILATMKQYADNLKKNLPTVEPQTGMKETVLNLEPIDIGQYASSLEQLNKRLAYIRQNLKKEETKKDFDMEQKLEVLNQNVKLFKEMADGNSLVSKCTAEISENLENKQSTTSQYEEIINKLLCGINDVTYLRQNKG